MGEKETPEMGLNGENLNASWDIVGRAADESFHRSLRSVGAIVEPNKYEVHDEQISPESYKEAIDITRKFGVGVRTKRGENRIGLAKRFGFATAIVFVLYVGAKELSESKMGIEDTNIGIKIEQKKVAQKGNVTTEQHSQGKTSKVEDLYPTGDIDGGSPGGMKEVGVPPAEAAKNVYGDGVYHEAIKNRQAEGKGVIDIGNKDYDEYLYFRNQGKVE